MNFLAGDIGGTKTFLRLEGLDAGQPRPGFERCYPSADFPRFQDLLARFIEEAGQPRIESACLAMAGPVIGSGGDRQTARITNLPWEMDSAQLSAAAGIARLRIINDFEAVGYGVPLLRHEQLVTLQAGRGCEHGLRVAIGAGTGFGTAIVSWCDGYQVHATEAGHASFAPGDADQAGLFQFLHERHGRVSIERVLSGRGLVQIHEYLLSLEGVQETGELARARRQGDAAASISAFAQGAMDPAAQRSLNLFVRIYGSQAGDIALKTLPRGGLYIAGGIAPKIIDNLRNGRFMEAFLDKSPMREPLLQIPVHVVMEPRVGLLGALSLARRQEQQGN